MAILSDSIVNGNLSVTDNIYVGGLRVATENDLNAAKQKFKDMVDGSITTITAEDLYGITEIAPNRFYKDRSLQTIELPNTVTSISDYAFQGSNIVEIIMSNSVTTLGSLCFSGCASLETVVLSNQLQVISGQSFQSCTSLETISIPNGVISIEQRAFYGCSALKNLNFGNTITSIGEYAFYRCANLTNITIPNSVISIGRYAFYECTGALNFTIGSGVTSIEYSAFARCTGLSGITIYATTPPTLTNTAFGSTNNCPIYVPSGSVTAYKSATNWSSYADRIYPIS